MGIDTDTRYWCTACGRSHPKSEAMLAHETSATPATRRGTKGSASPASIPCSCCEMNLFMPHGVGHILGVSALISGATGDGATDDTANVQAALNLEGDRSAVA